MKLSYCQPARKWEETLPIGNGSLGAMVWGTLEERLGLNLDTLWSGYERDKNNKDAYQYLSKARSLVFERKYDEAEALIEEHMLGEYNESYLPFGDLLIRSDMENVYHYQRELDLETATAKVSLKDESGNLVEREYIASYPEKAIVGHYKATSVINLSFSFQSQLFHEVTTKENNLIVRGQCPEHVDPNYIWDGKYTVVQGNRGMKFGARLHILSCDGEVIAEHGRLVVKHVTDIVFAFTANCPETEGEKINECDWNTILKRHIEDYRSIYGKTSIYLGEQPDIPTDIRLNNPDDPSLYALYFQYGRYLLIASSREGSQPANLQGIWSWEFRAPWSSNWTTNINTEMNYWPVDTCNLSECFEPYISFMKRICENGKKTAQIHYGCRGFTHHHNADYWCSTNPVGQVFGEDKGRHGATLWSFWPMGGAWLCQELYRHYEYIPDESYLRETLYPILREATLFLVDWLVEHDGVYTTCPSTSPENAFIMENGKRSCVASGTAMDLALIHEVWNHFESVCNKIEIDDPLLIEMREKRERLQPFQIGSYGQLLEWNEEFKESEAGHRHLSPIYGLHPSELWEDDERLKEASRILLEHRLKHGGGYTGWSCVWIINLFAILGDSEKAYEYLQVLLKRSTYDNLWDAHPPFQIDGNFGGIAGIASMLVQDRGGKVKVLPALPKQWKDGWVKGLRIKGGKTIDITWKDNVATKIIIHENN